MTNIPVTTNAVPNPGSQEALMRGCKCPIIDNHHGSGYNGIAGMFIYKESCPLHGRATISADDAELIDEEFVRSFWKGLLKKDDHALVTFNELFYILQSAIADRLAAANERADGWREALEKIVALRKGLQSTGANMMADIAEAALA